jgi:peptidoglycan/LPS O-acetylase OafA/YrhL
MADNRRYFVLDAMRGIAAIAVIAYHAGSMLHLRGLYIVKAAIAVDFFFCLSGFVLAHAHDADLRSGSLEAPGFFVRRIKRLLPMLLFGCWLGYLVIRIGFDDPYVPRARALPIALLSGVSLPYFFQNSFVWINPVFWSLFSELLVNAIYPLLSRSLKTRSLSIFVAVSSVLLIAANFYYNTSHLEYGAPLKSIFAFTRPLALFFEGVLLYRVYYVRSRPVRTSEYLVYFILVLPMIFPYSGQTFRMFFDQVFVLAVYPVLIFIAASIPTHHKRLCSWLGDLSYPAYALHFPVVLVVTTMTAPSSDLAKLSVVALIVVLGTLLATAVHTFYERPLLRWLARGSRQRTLTQAASRTNPSEDFNLKAGIPHGELSEQ